MTTSTRTYHDKKKNGYWHRRCTKCGSWKTLQSNYTRKNALSDSRNRICNQCTNERIKARRSGTVKAKKRGEYGSTLSVMKGDDKVICPKCQTTMSRRKLNEHRRTGCGSVR